MSKTLHISEKNALSGALGKTNDSKADIEFLADIPVRISVMLGDATITIRELIEMRVGTVIELDRPVGESLDLNVNGSIFGKVDVTVIEDTYGLRIAEIVNPFAG
ncbi:MAG: FliM/FliN family flagellar motor switch protein [Candidatus Coatesbacteria bacterium]|nr:FliM/FliN family flagellar motor switch protein [Candidatus Coatesbacteria bacterium]